MLGSGKSTLSYEINKKYNVPRLNLDEVSRNPKDGSYYNKLEQFSKLYEFTELNDDWVIEGCQKYLYEDLKPDLIIHTDISRLNAACRIYKRFNQAEALLGKKIDKNLPVQHYHYRKNKFTKLKQYSRINKLISFEIEDFVYDRKPNLVKIKSKRNYKKLFQKLEKNYGISKTS